MSFCDRVQPLRLECIPHVVDDPDRCFLGFSKCDQISDWDWDQVRVRLRNLCLEMYWRGVRRLTVENWPLLSMKNHPLSLYDRKDCLGFTLLKSPDDQTRASYLIKKVN